MSEENNISNLSEDTGPGEVIVKSKEAILSRKYLLKGKTIGISISESDNLSELGYSVMHLKDVMIEVARYIVSLGGTIAYGGDMRQGGFTELLFDLLAYYKADDELRPNERFHSFLAWPLSLLVTPEKEASLLHNVSFKKITPPHDVKIEDVTKFLEPISKESQYVWARCLTKMREEMELVCDARIFVGGRNRAFKGKLPGILEELLMAIEKKHPVFLIGAFGGITKDIISTLDGQGTESFSLDHYMANPEYKEFVALYNSKHDDIKIDYQRHFLLLQNYGFKALSEMNGLTEEENRRLTKTPHINEMIYLILKGLTNRFSF